MRSSQCLVTLGFPIWASTVSLGRSRNECLLCPAQPLSLVSSMCLQSLIWPTGLAISGQLLLLLLLHALAKPSSSPLNNNRAAISSQKENVVLLHHGLAQKKAGAGYAIAGKYECTFLPALKRVIVHSDPILAHIALLLAPDWSALAMVVFFLLGEGQICSDAWLWPSLCLSRSSPMFPLPSGFSEKTYRATHSTSPSSTSCISPPTLSYSTAPTSNWYVWPNNVPSRQGRHRLHHGRDLTCFILGFSISPWSCAW